MQVYLIGISGNSLFYYVVDNPKKKEEVNYAGSYTG